MRIILNPLKLESLFFFISKSIYILPFCTYIKNQKKNYNEFIFKIIYVVPFIILGPLPKESDKYFVDSIFFFTLISFLFRLFYLYMLLVKVFLNKNKILLYKIFILIIWLAISVTLHSAYFELQEEETIGLASDAVRKVAFFWPILVFITLEHFNLNKSYSLISKFPN